MRVDSDHEEWLPGGSNHDYVSRKNIVRMANEIESRKTCRRAAVVTAHDDEQLVFGFIDSFVTRWDG